MRAAAAMLAARDIRKSFGGVRALRGVSFDVAAGEVHALVGENGAGKSTLIRIMTGADTPDAGALDVAGTTVSRLDPATAHALGIAAIYQQPALFPDLTVAENVALGLEPARALARIDWPARRRRAQDLLDRLGAGMDPDAIAAELSLPEQQIVEIAKAIGVNARFVIMDEPTASLSRREVERLFGIIQKLREQWVGVVYISHRLEEVLAVADRITVLRDGQSLGTRARAEVTADDLVAMMVGREWSTAVPKSRVAGTDVALAIDGLSAADHTFAGISLELRRGEILGLAGLVGAGRTALAEALFGLRSIAGGSIRIDDRAVTIGSPADAIRLGLAYVPEDRRHSLVGALSVAANVSLSDLDAVSTHGLIDRRAERERADALIDRLQIKAPSSDALVRQLSGGNQQKVALARWLATSPRVLILDEPTQGVDIGAKAEIHALMQRLTEDGLGVLMISSDLPEVLAMSDRVAVMRGGRLAGVLDREAATESRVLALALGTETPVSR